MSSSPAARRWVQGQITLITGGACGLGRALVERFIAEGAQVAVLDRDEASLSELRADFGESVLTVQGDVVCYEDQRRAIQATVERFGRIDTYIGNAAIFDFGTPLETIEEQSLEAAIDEILAVNVRGYLVGARASVAELKKSRGSMIFTLSSIVERPGTGGVLYAASKAAGVGIVRQLAHELAPQVRVNAVAPGGMRTDLRGPAALGLERRSLRDELPPPEAVREELLLGRFFEPHEVAASYMLLASRTEGAALTGVILQADGGARVS